MKTVDQIKEAFSCQLRLRVRHVELELKHMNCHAKGAFE